MNKEKPTLQTVERALELIDIMAHSPNKMSVMEISTALGVTRTGAYNLLNALMKYNFAEKDPATNKYSIGYAFMELADLYRRQYPFLFAAERGFYMLSRKRKDQINITVYKRPGIALILRVKAPEEIQKSNQQIVFPAYITSGGKMLLASLPEKTLEEDLAQMELKRFAKNTITDKDELRKALEQIRQQGYATEREENFGMRGCVAAPIMNMAGEVIAAISIVVPLQTFDEHFQEYLSDVQDAAMQISQELGYNPYQA